MNAPLADRLASLSNPSSDDVLMQFLDYVTSKKLELYPAQEEALLELSAGKNIVLNTPTGSGKSLVATATHFKAMAEKKRSYYTCPIKALVSEKFFALCQEFGPEHVGMMTGDATINRDAPIICCTAEILANIALREGEHADADYVIIDEFHYYADRERGVAWQVPLLTLKNTTFVLMSATMGNTDFFVRVLTELTGKPTALIRSTQRPVPLTFEYRETPLHETIEDLIEKNRYPVYLVNFTQRACAEEAQNLMSTNFATKEEKARINEALKDVRFDSPYGKEVQKFVRHGIGLHHAGLLPKYRLIVEKLAQQGLLKIISGTDTLGVGVNIPIRTVLFTKLCKFDGEKTAILSVRDFKQIAGRAGRRGFDTEGFVVAQAPEHVIENLKLEAKAAGDPVKLRKLVRRKPPEKGYVHWDRGTYEKLMARDPEALQSRFSVSHGMLINLLQCGEDRPEGGYGRLISLINASHGDDNTKSQQRRMARMLFKSLVAANIVEFITRPGRKGRTARVSRDLQREFSANQTLSLYLVETLEKLDRESPDYALDVITLVESIVENPDVILLRQLDKLKGERVAELKAEGVEYEERMAELEKLEYPKPLRDFIYATFNDFSAQHPWVGHENIRPKSVVREMFDLYMSFDEYVREYDLHRAEGTVLRYISDVYKTLVQTVPESYRTDEVLEAISFLRTMIQRTDSSLLREWEELHEEPADPTAQPAPEADAQRRRRPNERAVIARVKNELFRLVRALSRRDYEEAARCVRQTESGEGSWTPGRFEQALEPYFAEHRAIRTDHASRLPTHTLIKRADPRTLEVQQTLVDPEDENLWAIRARVDLEIEAEPEAPILELDAIAP